eukprot:Phypoly_transcript_20728.p1 GENE.Phypoly_transcript_20728~~Phypoly_transcript_20728.p1  ORF type:complete len:156 (+),score=22.11 Phypoly_transcript_20728:169-636(+)
MQARALLVIVLLGLISAAFSSDSLARGWGDDITWHTLDAARALSKENGKPVMIIIHKSWCGACKRLKPDFAGSSDIVKLSANFNMVNALDDEEPADEEFKPDGGYIPRIFYLDPATQKVRTDIYNKAGSDKYKYFYSDASAVLAGMKSALSAFKA